MGAPYNSANLRFGKTGSECDLCIYSRANILPAMGGFQNFVFVLYVFISHI